MKFYETDIPVMATDDEGDVDRSRIVPVATGAEPYRGMEILDTILRLSCDTHTKLHSHHRKLYNAQNNSVLMQENTDVITKKHALVPLKSLFFLQRRRHSFLASGVLFLAQQVSFLERRVSCKAF